MHITRKTVKKFCGLPKNSVLCILVVRFMISMACDTLQTTTVENLTRTGSLLIEIH